MRGEYSLSDIRAVTDGNNGGFGDNSAWWLIVLIVLFGWNRGGYGNNNDGGNTVPFYQSLDTDFATIERKIDGVYSGICDATFSLNNTITNGNAAIQNTLTQGFAGLNTGMVQQGYENRIAVGNIGTQLASCCCDLKGLIADNKYEMAKGFCSTNNTIAMSTRDIVDNMNANYRALHDEIVANRIEDKNAQITAQQNEINALRLAASQEKQNNLITQGFANEVDALYNRLSNCPVPTTPVYGRTPIFTCGCNNNCGCNSGCGY